MLKKVLIGLVVVVALFLGFVQLRPAEFHIERSLAMNAPQSIPFGYINDFHKWASWSPWDKLDPNMKREFTGAESGTGAGYGWSGNDQVGSGKMLIAESLSPEQVKIDLHFLAPWEQQNRTTFSIRSSGAGSVVTWMMDGENDFMGKAAGLFMDIDQMVGKDFELGLQNLKRLSEADAAARATSSTQAAAADAAALQAQAEAAALAAAAASILMGGGGLPGSSALAGSSASVVSAPAK
jgi:hypothetical protein